MTLWVGRACIRAIPEPIADEEVLVRAVTSNYVDKQGRLKKDLYIHRGDLISVTRGDFVALWLIKAYAKAVVADATHKPAKLFLARQ